MHILMFAEQLGTFSYEGWTPRSMIEHVSLLLCFTIPIRLVRNKITLHSTVIPLTRILFPGSVHVKVHYTHCPIF